VAETLRRSIEQLHVTGQVIVAGQRLRSARVLPELYQQRGAAHAPRSVPGMLGRGPHLISRHGAPAG
jgi:hypothetical protein